MLFDDAVKAYWEDKSKRLRGNTLEGYASAIRKHLMPAWSGRELESITHDEVQAWVDGLQSYGAAVSCAAGNSILWRTSFDVTVGSQWHEGQLVFPVSRT